MLRNLLSCLVLLFLPLVIFSQGPLITEISYDNNYDQNDPFGIDSIEYVEVYLPDPQPTDLTQWVLSTYDPQSGNSAVAELFHTRTLAQNHLTWDTPNGMYYVVEFQDSVFFGFPIAGMNDGQSGVALTDVGSGTTHAFWRYETCENFVAADGPAAGLSSVPITTDASRMCGSSGVSLVQMNSALSTTISLQQNGFGDWELDVNSSSSPPLENSSNVPVELQYFNLRRLNADIMIEWSTAQEFNNEKFVIEHSMDGIQFESLYEIPGKGDSEYEVTYRKLDKNASKGLHYYRLVQHDLTGEFTYLGVRTIELKSDEQLLIFPTNTNAILNIKGYRNNAEYEIYSFQGVMLKNGIVENGIIDVTELPKGTFMLKVDDENLRFNKF